MMAFADVKIFDFTVYPGKVEGEQGAGAERPLVAGSVREHARPDRVRALHAGPRGRRLEGRLRRSWSSRRSRPKWFPKSAQAGDAARLRTAVPIDTLSERFVTSRATRVVELTAREGGSCMRRWSIPAGLVLRRRSRSGCHREVEMIPLDRADHLPDRSLLRRPGAHHGPRLRRRLRRQDPRDDATAAATGSRRAERRRRGALRRPLRRREPRLDRRPGRPHPAHRRRRQDLDRSRSRTRPSRTSDGTTQARSTSSTSTPSTSDHAWAVGDRSILTSTADGGKTWRARKVAMEADLSGGAEPRRRRPDLLRRQVHRPRRTAGSSASSARSCTHATAARPGRSRRRRCSRARDLRPARPADALRRRHAATRRTAIAAGLEAHIARTRDGGEQWTYDKIEVGDVRSSTRSSTSSSSPTAPAGRSARRARSCGPRPAPTSGRAPSSARTCSRGSAASASPTRSTAGWSAASGSSITPRTAARRWLPSQG